MQLAWNIGTILDIPSCSQQVSTYYGINFAKFELDNEMDFLDTHFRVEDGAIKYTILRKKGCSLWMFQRNIYHTTQNTFKYLPSQMLRVRKINSQEYNVKK